MVESIIEMVKCSSGFCYTIAAIDATKWWSKLNTNHYDNYLMKLLSKIKTIWLLKNDNSRHPSSCSITYIVSYIGRIEGRTWDKSGFFLSLVIFALFSLCPIVVVECKPQNWLIKNNFSWEQKTRSTSYGRRLVFKRSWVWMTAPD